MLTLRRHFGWEGPATSGNGPALVLLSGLPGTGKSYVAQQLEARYPVAVVRTDTVRKVLFSQPRYTADESAAVYLTCYSLIRDLLRDGYAVVFDATNLLKNGRRRAQQIAVRAGAPFLVIVTTCPPEVVAERLERRLAGQAEAFHSDADWQVHKQLASTAETVHEPSVIVDTSKGIEPALAAFEALVEASGTGTDADGGTSLASCPLHDSVRR